MSNIEDDVSVYPWYAYSIENCIRTDGLRGSDPAEAFFMPGGRWQGAKKTKEAVFLPRLSQPYGGTVL